MIEQQSYLLEELLALEENQDTCTPAYNSVVNNFELALSDFGFCLDKALKNVTQQDVFSADQDLRMLSSSKRTPKIYNESDLKVKIENLVTASQKRLTDNTNQVIGKYFPTYKLTSLADVKQLCSRILKQLREELAASQTVYIRRLNADLIELE